MLREARQNVEFSLNDDENAEMVLLAIGQPDQRSTGVFALQRAHGQGWHTNLQLKPGLYAARYYVGCARGMHYHGPAFPVGRALWCGLGAMDGEFLVTSDEPARNEAELSTC